MLSLLSLCACGPSFPNSYLAWGEEEKIILMPDARFSHELNRLTGTTNQLFNPWSMADRHAEQQEIKADRDDLDRALGDQLPDTKRKEILWHYEQLRRGMKSVPARHAADAPDPRRHLKVLRDLPREFRLYVQGAWAFHYGFTSHAIGNWERLLALSEEERQYRSTWAAFMLGRIQLDNTDIAVPYFKLTRSLAREGFRDSLNLAANSLGWQAHSALNEGDLVNAIHLYGQQYASSDYGERLSAYSSLRQVCREQMHPRNPIPISVIHDDLCRQVITAWALSTTSWDGEDERGAWCKTLAESGLKKTIKGADRLAWLAYQSGNMDQAKTWLSWSDPQALCGQWVRAKLLLREGNPDAALEILYRVAQTPAPQETWHAWDMDEYRFARPIPASDAYAEIGVILLGQSRYTEALHAFLRGRYWTDAAYIGERVMTIKELETYISAHKHDKVLISGHKAHMRWWYEASVEPPLEGVCYLLARRLARQDQWERAQPYFPTNMQDTVSSFTQQYRAGQDTSRPRQKRAEHLFQAAKLLRSDGMRLIGTELEPDWSVYGGLFELGNVAVNRSKAGVRDQPFPALTPTVRTRLEAVIAAQRAETTRARQHAVSPDKRYHYRYHAADLMWQAAALLPDNHELTARALYFGGGYLKDRDPKAADRFYKALVNRCRGLPIGRLADEQRWFPRGYY